MHVELQIDIDLSCAECGADLRVSHGGNARGTENFTVSPCPVCLDAAKEEGKEQARQDSI